MCFADKTRNHGMDEFIDWGPMPGRVTSQDMPYKLPKVSIPTDGLLDNHIGGPQLGWDEAHFTVAFALYKVDPQFVTGNTTSYDKLQDLVKTDDYQYLNGLDYDGNVMIPYHIENDKTGEPVHPGHGTATATDFVYGWQYNEDCYTAEGDIPKDRKTRAHLSIPGDMTGGGKHEWWSKDDKDCSSQEYNKGMF